MANVKQLKTLLAAGANVHVKNKDGLSPLAYAVNSGKHGNEIFAPLLKAGADPNEVMPSGVKVVDLAKEKGRPLPV